jgi:hypothetical protein
MICEKVSCRDDYKRGAGGRYQVAGKENLHLHPFFPAFLAVKRTEGM